MFNKNNNLLKEIVSCLTALMLCLYWIVPPGLAQEFLNLPTPGAMVESSESFVPPLIKGIMIDPENPFHLDFIIDTGNQKLIEDEIASESEKMIRYFLASLTVPEQDLWVNLSPYEKDRIVPDGFGITEMGRDLLAQDYILKQLTATLLYPEKDLGEEFWETVHARAFELYGKVDIPVNTFNKVWIVPDTATIYEGENVAYVQDSHLKVMLDADYLAAEAARGEIKDVGREMQDEIPSEAHSSDAMSAGRQVLHLTSDVVREVLLPEIEREVNEGKRFSPLRQIYHSLILAAWFKENLKQTILSQVYVDQNKVTGVDIDDKDAKTKIYQRYLEAFQKGVYNYIKEEYDPASAQIIPRKYFSGGMNFGENVSSKVTKKRFTPKTSTLIQQGITGVMILVTALLLNADISQAEVRDAIAKDSATPIVQIDDPNVQAVMDLSKYRKSSNKLFSVVELTAEEKANIKEVAQKRVKAHLDIYRKNMITTIDTLSVLGLDAVAYLIPPILDEKESPLVKEEAAKILYALTYMPEKSFIYAVGEEDSLSKAAEEVDPRIINEVIPAAFEILEQVEDAEVRRYAIKIIQNHKVRPQNTQQLQSYVSGMIADQQWEEIVNFGEIAIAPLMEAVKTNDLIYAGGAVRVLGQIGASEDCSLKSRRGIVDYLKTKSVGIQTADEGTPLGALAEIASAGLISDSLREEIAEFMLNSGADVDEAISLIALVLPEGRVFDMAVDRIKQQLKSDKMSDREEAAETLLQVSWHPQTLEEKVLYHFGNKNWKALISLGSDSKVTASVLEVIMADIEHTLIMGDSKIGMVIEHLLGDYQGTDRDGLARSKVLDKFLTFLENENQYDPYLINQMLKLSRMILSVQGDLSYIKDKWASLVFDQRRFQNNNRAVALEVAGVVAVKLAGSPVTMKKNIAFFLNEMVYSYDMNHRIAATHALMRMLNELSAHSPVIIETVEKMIQMHDKDNLLWTAEELKFFGEVAKKLNGNNFVKAVILPLLWQHLIQGDEDQVPASVKSLGMICEGLGADASGFFEKEIFPTLSGVFSSYEKQAIQVIQEIGENMSMAHPLKGLMHNLFLRSATFQRENEPGELEKGILVLDDLFHIYKDVSFNHFTKGMHSMNQFSFARAIDMTLKRFGLTVNYEQISALSPFLDSARTDYKKHVFLHQGSSVITAINDDWATFSPQSFDGFFQPFFPGLTPSQYKQQVADPFIGIDNQAKDNLRNKIRMSQGETFIYLNGHGDKKHFWMHSEDNDKQFKDTLGHARAIDYKEMAADLIARAKNNNGELGDLNLFVDACFSGDFLTNVYNELVDAFIGGKIKSLPYFVASTNRGVVSWNFLNQGNGSSFLLRGLKEASQGATKLTGAHVLKSETYTYISQVEDVEIFIPFTKEKMMEVQKALKITPDPNGNVRYFTLGSNNASKTDFYLNELLPVMGGLIGNKVLGEIADGQEEGVKELKVFNKQLEELATRELQAVDHGQQRMVRAVNQLKEKLEGENDQILNGFLRLLEKAPPQLLTYDNPIQDLFGKASSDHDLIALTRELLGNHVALFHELGEFFVQTGQLLLDFNAKQDRLTVTIDGVTVSVPLSGRALSLAEQSKEFVDGKMVYNPHYLLRALQYSMFKDYDVKLTEKIEQMQQETTDDFAVATQASQDRTDERVGGIDLNPVNLQISKKGSGIRLNLPETLKVTPDSTVTGLKPLILQMNPVFDLPSLLNINK